MHAAMCRCMDRWSLGVLWIRYGLACGRPDGRIVWQTITATSELGWYLVGFSDFPLP